ncbi:MAG: hypothetical protein HC810_04145 [Acaryochloridaceae cyanobacterium RL_2_7]|nr:hypothetical protein [Acaryochloridaceae cyanobacterium RL_2_7]
MFLFVWKGAPPDAAALEEILVTPLGRDLANEFREEGSIGIRRAFSNFFGMQQSEQLKQLEADLKSTTVQLSDAVIASQNKDAIAQTQSSLATPSTAHHFESLEQFRALFVPGVIDLPAIADTFQDDEVFAYMRLAGPNPVMLEKLTEQKNFFHKFPVTDSQYQAVMGPNDDLNRAMAEGRLYGVNYGLLDGALLGTFGSIPEAQKYLYPAIALFAVPDQSSTERYLKPIAIQCGQDPATYPLDDNLPLGNINGWRPSLPFRWLTRRFMRRSLI